MTAAPHLDQGISPSQMVVEGSVTGFHSSPVRAAEGQDDGLNDRQRAFVDFYCGGIPADISSTGEEFPAGHAGEAARAAGYADSGSANMASRNLLNPKVQAEVERRVRMGRGSALLTGTTALFAIVERGKDERAVVAAAIALMDRFGLAPPKGPLVAIQNNVVGGDAAATILKEVAESRLKRLSGGTENG